jgi:CheY-like chemotaxis protein
MGGTLLLADDSITIQKVVELTFAETEHTVVAVGNGRDLLARLETVQPDVVLCDVVMPDFNGYDICQRIKSEPTTLHIPVVLLTGTFEPFDRDRALAAGCDAIVTKPFEAKELIATVEELLQRSQSYGEAPIEAPSSSQELGVPAGVQGIDFTTTGFERMVAQPKPPELPPVDGIDLTTSSFQSQIGAPAPVPPPELADDDGASLAVSQAPLPLVPEAPPEANIEELTASPEDQTTPSGPPLTPAERQAAALALLEEVGRRTEGTAAAPPEVPSSGFVFAEERIEEPVAEAPPPVLAGTEIEAAAVETSPPAAPVAAVVPPAPITVPAPQVPAIQGELSQDQVDRIARRVLELADPLIERIAWEVIPDMAEMLVRQRIRELEEAAEEES